MQIRRAASCPHAAAERKRGKFPFSEGFLPTLTNIIFCGIRYDSQMFIVLYFFYFSGRKDNAGK